MLYQSDLQLDEVESLVKLGNIKNLQNSQILRSILTS